MDSVRLQALERAELNDLLALQGLTYEHIRRALGHLLGSPNHTGDTGEGGLISKPALTYNSTAGTLALSSFSYLELTRGGATITAGQTATPEARLIRFDSGASGHTNHPIDISAHSTANTYMSVWARFTSINEDIDARRAWSVTQSTEISITIPTRERERVEFTVRLTADGRPTDSGASRWVALFDYFISSGGALNVTTYHHGLGAADDEIEALYSVPADKIDMSEELDEITTAQGASYGLTQQLSHIRALLYRIQHQGAIDTTTAPNSSRWSSTTVKSLRQLDIELANTINDLEAVEVRATTLENRTAGQIFSADFQLHAQITLDPNTLLATTKSHTWSSSPDPNALLFSLLFDYTRAPTETGTFDGLNAFNSIGSFLDVLARPVLSFNLLNPFNIAWILSADVRALGYDADTDAFNNLSEPNYAYSDVVAWRPIIENPADPTTGATYENAVMRLGDRAYTAAGGTTMTQQNSTKMELNLGGQGYRPYSLNMSANAAGNYVFHFIFTLRLSNRGSF